MDIILGVLPATAPRPLAPDMAIWVERNQLYAKQVWWLLSSFIILVSAGQLGSWVASRAFSRLPTSGRWQDKDVEDRARVSKPRRRDWSRLPLALVNYFRVFAFRSTIDIGPSISVTYAEAFITTAYIIAIFTWEFINTTNLAGSMLDWQYWSTRAGTLAVSQFPLITVLGTKNNLLAYITGVSFDKLNFVHRMTARVTFILLWVHGGSKLIRILLIGAYAHANQAARLGPYIIPCFLIWGTDRALRLARIIHFNPLPFRSQSSSAMRASVELLSPQFVKLRVPRGPQLKWTPGQAAFLLVPGVARVPLEAHPFTIASRVGGVLSKRGKGDTLQDVDVEELVFFINVREGFTRRLADAARRGEEVSVLVDGPYGFSPNLKHDDTVVLVAGGSGVSLALSTFLGVVSDVERGLSRCSRVVFIWSIRDPKQLEWIADSLATALDLAPPALEIVIRVFVTGRPKSPEPTETSSSSSSSSLSVPSPSPDASPSLSPNANANEDDRTVSSAPRTLTSFPEVHVGVGRPDIPKMLRDEVGRADAGSRLSVTVCGSAAVAKVCRDALRLPFAATLDGAPSVVLHVESFGYA